MPAPKNPNTEAARAARAANARQRRHKEMAADLRASGEWLVLSRQEVISMLADPAYQDGLTPAFLRGYLHIE